MARGVAGRGWAYVFVVAIAGAVLATVLVTRSSGEGKVSVSIAVRTHFSTAAPGKIRVTMNSDHGNPQVTSISWGDGNEDSEYSGFCVGGPGLGRLSLPVISTLPRTQSSVDFVHVFRRPGRYRVTVHAIEYSFCTGSAAPTKDGPSGKASILFKLTVPRRQETVARNLSWRSCRPITPHTATVSCTDGLTQETLTATCAR